MDIARVIGLVVATKKVESMEGVKIFLIQSLNENLKPVGEPIFATDIDVQTGIGELVYFVTGGDATMVAPDGVMLPLDASIVGIVDKVSVDERFTKKQES